MRLSNWVSLYLLQVLGLHPWYSIALQKTCQYGLVFLITNSHPDYFFPSKTKSFYELWACQRIVGVNLTFHSHADEIERISVIVVIR